MVGKMSQKMTAIAMDTNGSMKMRWMAGNDLIRHDATDCDKRNIWHSGELRHEF